MILPIIASDIDGTLIPYSDNSEQKKGRQKFSMIISSLQNTTLCYVTGRSLKLSLEAITTYELPTPNFMICDVGASFYSLEAGQWIYEPEYHKKLRRAWLGNTAEEAKYHLTSCEYLTPQEPEHQSEFKLSYYLPLSIDRETVLNELNGRLVATKIPSHIIYSIDPVMHRGLIDILPEGVGKDTAINHLCELKGVDYSNLLYAGDSGNDFSAFCAGYKIIMVANTPQEIKASVVQFHGGSDNKKIFISQHDSILGVLEGLQHFFEVP